MLARIALKTSPDACKVLSSGKGRVVICIEDPTILLSKNKAIPICHLGRLYGALLGMCSSFSSSNMCDLRCNVRPID